MKKSEEEENTLRVRKGQIKQKGLGVWKKKEKRIDRPPILLKTKPNEMARTRQVKKQSKKRRSWKAEGESYPRG